MVKNNFFKISKKKGEFFVWEGVTNLKKYVGTGFNGI